MEMTRWVPIQSTPNIQDCSPFGSANFTESIPPWRDYQALAVKYYPAISGTHLMSCIFGKLGASEIQVLGYQNAVFILLHYCDVNPVI
jgi:hypothetical protein